MSGGEGGSSKSSEFWTFDPEPLNFVEGNRYSVDFHMFAEPWEVVVYAPPDPPWVEHIGPILAKKGHLGVGAWGGTDAEIRHVMGPLEELFAAEYALQTL